MSPEKNVRPFKRIDPGRSPDELSAIRPIASLVSHQFTAPRVARRGRLTVSSFTAYAKKPAG